MEFSFDIVWLVAVIVFGIFKFIKRASTSSAANEPGEADQESAQPAQAQAGDGVAAPIFAYYYTSRGEKRIDVNETKRLSGREVTEYEIFSEQQRLDKLWAAELERQETEFLAGREEIYEAAQPVETPDMAEILAAAREKTRGEEREQPGLRDAQPVQTTRNSDREYQLSQLDRWLEAGLIDKAEYRKRKREL